MMSPLFDPWRDPLFVKKISYHTGRMERLAGTVRGKGDPTQSVIGISG